MNGIQDYENKIEKLIKNKLIEYPELDGFANYIINLGSLSTNYNYLIQIIRFLEKTNKTEKELTLDNYTSYLASLRSRTAGYQRCAYFALKRYSEYLFYSGKATINPMINITAPKNVESIITKEKREKAFLTKEEVEEIFNNINKGVGNNRSKSLQENWKERDKAIILLFLSTGIRCSALFKLDINNINWEESTIIVMDKGSKVHKYILPQKTILALKEWINKREELLEGIEENALFISNRRTRLCQSSISDLIKKYTFNIDGKHITPHKLRATFGTHLYNETRDIKFVQDQMGHSNPQTTELYIRGNKDADRKKAADIMSDFLDN